ncbi:MAG: hypothetical protein K8R88_12300 [Armatimonadetes bacterium]|nr:hypothetical protein [Armatimonadota bacterium]
MKICFRSALVLCSFGPFVAAHAQDFRFYYGYGDQATATLNGRAVGDEILQASPLRVHAGGRFKLQVWTEKLTSQDFVTVAISVHMAYDRAISSNGSNIQTSAFMHRKIAFAGPGTGSSASNFGTFDMYDQQGGIVDVDQNGVQDAAPLRPTIIAPHGEYLPGGDYDRTERRAGLGTSLILNTTNDPGHWFKMGTQGTKSRLYDYEFKNNLGVGESYGDAPLETGIGITYRNSAHGSQLGHSFVGAGNLTSSGTQLTVQAVPEPSGLAVVTLFIIAFGRRRNDR